jgi:hypothetical protein
MGALPRKWIKWIAVLLGVVGMLTPALLELGWIPREHALDAVIFLLGFIVLDSAASEESNKPSLAPVLMTNSEDYYHVVSGLMSESKHEVLMVVRGDEILVEPAQSFIQRTRSTLVREKQLHIYLVVSSHLAEVKEEAFQRRLTAERDPSYEGRMHFRFIESPVTFGCLVFDQKHWVIDFPPNPADIRGGAIVFRDDPPGARLVSSFIHHQWLEQPGVTMSLSEAYEKWKAIKAMSAIAE